MNAKPTGDPRFVGLRITCAACDDNRRIGLVGLYTFEGDDGQVWFEGAGVDPAGYQPTVTFRCRAGHNVPMRLASLIPKLQQMREDVGIDGRRVVSASV
jgi:hypothetical protein